MSYCVIKIKYLPPTITKGARLKLVCIRLPKALHDPEYITEATKPLVGLGWKTVNTYDLACTIPYPHDSSEKTLLAGFEQMCVDGDYTYYMAKVI